MQGFGKLCSASPSFPRGSLLVDQSSRNTAHQIARLATEVLVVLGMDSSLLSSAFLGVWKIVCGACWIQLLVIFLHSLRDTAPLKNIFPLFVQLIDSKAIFGLVLHQEMRKTVDMKICAQKQETR